MTRQKANLEILQRIAQDITDYPDLRFGQILRNLGVIREKRNAQGIPEYWINSFNEEPEVTLNRMKDEENARRSGR